VCKNWFKNLKHFWKMSEKRRPQRGIFWTHTVVLLFLCSVISQGKTVALNRWDGKWNHLSMTHSLTADYGKSYCNWTLIVQVILENVVTCFFLRHSVYHILNSIILVRIRTKCHIYIIQMWCLHYSSFQIYPVPLLHISDLCDLDLDLDLELMSHSHTVWW